jgi:hypothetical protein
MISNRSWVLGGTFLTVVLTVVLTSCSYDVFEEEVLDNETVCDTTSMNYSKIQQILVGNNCMTCHTGVESESGVDFSTYQALDAYVSNPDNQFIMRLTTDDPELRMPRMGLRMGPCNINKIKAWLNAGHPE